MAQVDQLSLDVPIKSSAENFYGFFRNKMPQLIQLFPNNLQSCEFLEGNDSSTGSVMAWSYNIVGPAKLKAKVTNADELNKSIAYDVIEGDVLSQYSLFRAKFRASNNGENGGATVNWSLEFKKANEIVPSPIAYMDFISVVSIGLDAYLIANQLISVPLPGL